MPGYSLEYDNATTYCGSTGLSGKGVIGESAFTVRGYFYSSTPGFGEVRSGWLYAEEGTGSSLVYVRQISGRIYFGVTNAAGDFASVSSPLTYYAAWTNFQATFSLDGSSQWVLTLYIDGSSVATTTGSAWTLPSGSDQISIGHRQSQALSAANVFEGRLTRFACYTADLAGAGGCTYSETNRKHFWAMDSPSNGEFSLKDTGSSPHNLTMNGFVEADWKFDAPAACPQVDDSYLDCWCCDPPHAINRTYLSPCGLNNANVSTDPYNANFDVASGFTCSWTGLDGDWDTTFYSVRSGGEPNFRKIQYFRTTALGTTWSVAVSNEEYSESAIWLPTTFVLLLQQEDESTSWVEDASGGFNMKVTLRAVPHGTLVTNGEILATWRLSVADPYTDGDLVFDIDDDFDEIYLGDFRLTNWHLYDGTKTTAACQTLADEMELNLAYYLDTSDWHQVRGNTTLGALITIDPAEAGTSVFVNASTAYDAVSPVPTVIPSTLTLTGACLYAQEPITFARSPCYKQTWKDPTLQSLDNDLCATGTGSFTVTRMDQTETLSFWLKKTALNWLTEWDASVVEDYFSALPWISVVNHLFCKHGGTWYKFAAHLYYAESSWPTTAAPGTDDTVWRAYGGDWSSGEYDKGSWVRYLDGSVYRWYYNVIDTETEPTAPSSDWSVIGSGYKESNDAGTCVAPCEREVRTADVYRDAEGDFEDTTYDCRHIQLLDLP